MSNNKSNPTSKSELDKKPAAETEKSPREKEIEMFTTQLAKKIQKLNSQSKKPRNVRSISFNPIIIGVTVVLLMFISFSLFNQPISSETLSITEVFDGLRTNRFSQLTVQNDGVIQAKEKSYLITSDSIDVKTIDTELIDTAKPSAGLKSVSFAEIKSLFQEQDLVTRIRNTQSVSEVLFANDFTIVLTQGGDESYIIEGVNEQDFKNLLQNEGISLDSLPFKLRPLRVFGQQVNGDTAVQRADAGLVEAIIDTGSIIIMQIPDNKVSTFNIDWNQNISSFVQALQEEGFAISGSDLTYEVLSSNIPAGITLDTILTLLTIVGFVFLGFIIFRSAQSSGMGIMQFGQSKAKMFFGKKTEVSFKDVAGIDEAREELNEIVEFLRQPNKFRKLGARIPKGILMYGPPGTGKTLLARAIAGEAGVPFFHTSGSEFEEMLVGAGASRVRDLFDKAKKAAPSLIFIDEIDAVARKRGTRIQSGTTEQTLNQILVEMDGFEKNTNVIVIAATNRPDVLDDAILRPGRFDRQVRIELPDKDGRMQILLIHTKNKPLAKNVDLERIAKRTVGFTGADLENIMNEAAIIAAKVEANEIDMKHVEEAVEKVILGPAKRSRKRTEKELQLVAYHEAGHALVAWFTEKAVPVEKISIVSRGNSGGVTMFIPDKDENIVSKKRLLADIKVALGGRAAEEIALDDISTGASNDIEQATQTARKMIQRFGMSEQLGLIQYGQPLDSQYLGYHYGDSKDYSEKTAEKIDEEVRTLIHDSYKYDLSLLKSKRYLLDKLANLLLDKEVLDREEFEKLFKEEEGSRQKI